MESFDQSDIKKIFSRLAQIMKDNRDYLIELDSATGDGDLGLTMTLGFEKIDEIFRTADEPDVGKLIAKAGMTMAQSAPSTMGTLMAAGMMRGGKALSGKTDMGSADFAEMLRAFEEGIMTRGKAKPGDRTVLDSIHPAILALEDLNDKSFSQILSLALIAAEKGVEATKTMEPVFGRAQYHKENALRTPDQGAVVGMLFIKGFAEYADAVK
jgi:dihydroxyacetone kinase-like protein